MDLHPAPHRAAVFGRMQVDAGISPSLYEKLAAKIEVLVLTRGAQPCGIASTVVDHD
jgi:hypothetical protein